LWDQLWKYAKKCNILINLLVSDSGSCEPLFSASGSCEHLVSDSGSCEYLVSDSGSCETLVNDSGSCEPLVYHICYNTFSVLMIMILK
jgi:hypothetical protein